MSYPKPETKGELVESQREFGNRAELFLIQAYRIVRGGARLESKIQVITVMQGVKNLLSTLEEEVDPSWEERAQSGTFSVDEFDLAAQALVEAGHRLQEAMSAAWPLKDEMSGLLDDIAAVRELVRKRSSGMEEESPTSL